MQYARRSILRIGMVLLVCITGAASAAPADEAREAWLAGHTYEKTETFTTGGKKVEAYAAKLGEADADRDIGVHRFLVVEGDTVGSAYSVDVLPGQEFSSVELVTHSSDVDATSDTIEIALARGTVYATARRLVEDALAADALWTAASGALEKAIGETEPEARRTLALAATRVLDRVYAAHPDHVGLLHDLLTAYQLLLPLEASTDRGANVSFLWRDRLRTYVRLRRSDEFAFDVLGRTLSSCGIAEGCYALAWLGADVATKHGHAYGEGVLSELEHLGQEHQDLLSHDWIESKLVPLRVAAFRCPGEPKDTGVPFHRLTWLTYGGTSGDTPTPIWYSLTCERTGERSRWALYGNVGGSRRLLRLFGSEEPAADDVTTLVRAQIQVAIADAEARK